MPRAPGPKAPRRTSPADRLDVLDELALVDWPPLLIPNTGFKSIEDMRAAWNRHRGRILEHYIDQRPGSRPFACYVFGEIEPPRLRHEVPRHEHGLVIGDTTWFPKWYYLGSATGPGGYYHAGSDYGEYRYLVDLGILGRDEIRLAEEWIDDREYQPGREPRRYDTLAR